MKANILSRNVIKEAPIFAVGDKIGVDGYLLDNGIWGRDYWGSVVAAYDDERYLLRLGEGYVIADELLLMGEPFDRGRVKVEDFGVVFFGSGGLGVPTLRRLCEAGFDIRAVVTHPWRGRGQGDSPVGEAARELGLRVLRDVSDVEGCDIGVCIDFSIIPEDVIGRFRLGVLNLHTSLLPWGRGASPVFHTIRDGLTEAGLSVIQIDAGVDTGNVVVNLSVPVLDGDTAGSLTEVLAADGAVMMEDAMRRVIAGQCGVEQSEIVFPYGGLGYCPKVGRDDTFISPYATKGAVERLVRASMPKPRAWMKVVESDGRVVTLRLGGVRVTDLARGVEGLPGYVRDEGGRLLMDVIDGVVEVTEVQGEGGRMMSGRDFVNGRRGYRGWAIDG